MKTRNKLAEQHAIDVFPLPWNDFELDKVNLANAEASFLAGYDSRNHEVARLRAEIKKLREGRK